MASYNIITDKIFTIKEIGYFKSFRLEEELQPLKYSIEDSKIVVDYAEEYSESVWINNERVFQDFPKHYEVMSGGWYGGTDGGRWRCYKRKIAKVEFYSISDLQEKTIAQNNQAIILKSRLSNHFSISFESPKFGLVEFKCAELRFMQAHKFFLVDKEKQVYTDMTEKLSSDGLKYLL